MKDEERLVIEYTFEEIEKALERMPEERKARLRELVKQSIWRDLARFAVMFAPKEQRGREYLRLTDWTSRQGREARQRIERSCCTLTGMFLEMDRATERARQRDRQATRREKKRIALSLDEPIDEDGLDDGTPRHEVLPDPGSADPLARVLASESLAERLDAAGLTPREREVAELLAAGYGQSDVADLLGLTAGRVSQICGELRKKLR